MEESKAHLPGTCVMGCEPHCQWVVDMLEVYKGLRFILPDGRLDLTPNTTYFSDRLEKQGALLDGTEKDVYVNDGMSRAGALNEPLSLNDKVFYLHVFPVHYFCPQLTTGENVRNEETYCEHKGESSWVEKRGWKSRLMGLLSPKWKTRIIKLKRKLLG